MKNAIRQTPTRTKSQTTNHINTTVIILLPLINRAMADEEESNPPTKRKRGAPPALADFYIIGKEVQNRSGQNINSTMTEDRRFRDFFGAGAMVALAAWNLLTVNDFLPEGGTILHFLWALYFMKVYPKQGVACAAAGGSGGAVDPKTFRKFVWPFIYALAELESIVVRQE